MDLLDRGAGDGTVWEGEVDDLLYDGETVSERVGVGDAEVVVTSHRVLVLSQSGPGSNYEYAERPNVVGVGLGHLGEAGHLERAIRYGVMGAVVLGAGQVVDLEGMIPDVEPSSSAGQLGLGGMLGTFQSALDLLANLDQYLTILGALVLLFAVAFAGLYLQSRERVFEVELAGEDDLRVPLTGEADGDDIERVRRALRGDGPTPDPL